MAATVILALGANQVMTVVSQQAQRDREAELMRIGDEVVAAIGAYYEKSPGNVRQYPPSLDHLVEDRRFVGIKRHLRRVYADPLAPGSPWGLVLRADGSLEGIYSNAPGQPVHSAAPSYADWKFVFVPPPVQPRP
jgi:hypothetical protein